MTEEGFPASGNDTKKKRDKTDFTLESQQNLMKVVEYLSTDPLRPTTMDEIMKALSITKNKAEWTLHNLKLRGWTEQIANGWRLGPRLPKIAADVKKAIDTTAKKYTGGNDGE